MFTIDVANTIFVICLAVGGILLLLTVLLDDVLGGLLEFLQPNDRPDPRRATVRARVASPA